MVTMNARGKDEQQKSRKSVNSLCGISSLLCSIVCCIVVIHMESKMKEHDRQIIYSVTFCNQLNTKLQQLQLRWRDSMVGLEEKGKVTILRPHLLVVNKRSRPEKVVDCVKFCGRIFPIPLSGASQTTF